MYFNSLTVPLIIVPRATLGTRTVGCRRKIYKLPFHSHLGLTLLDCTFLTLDLYFGSQSNSYNFSEQS
jgi:hypothetical protein